MPSKNSSQGTNLSLRETCFLLAVGIFAIFVFSGGFRACFPPRRAQSSAEKQKEYRERAEKVKQERAKKDEKTKQKEFERLIEKAIEDAEWEKEEAKQPMRKELIAKLISLKIFEKVEYEAGVKIWVSDSFYALSFDQKQLYCNVVVSYFAVVRRTKLMGVELRDNKSGKVVGNVSGWTGVLKME